MTHRILKLFRWHFHLDNAYGGPDSLVWRKDGYRGVTIHKLGGFSLFGGRRLARLVHLGGTLAEGHFRTDYNAPHKEAHMHTSQFHLESDAPIAFVSFSWWKEDLLLNLRVDSTTQSTSSTTGQLTRS